MSETAIKAPKVNHWIFVLKDGKFVFDKKTLEAIDKVYAILEAVEPCGEDNRRELWLKAERGTIDDYDDHESLKDEEVVENYEEFEKMWHEEYVKKCNRTNRGLYKVFYLKQSPKFLEISNALCYIEYKERHLLEQMPFSSDSIHSKSGCSQVCILLL